MLQEAISLVKRQLETPLLCKLQEKIASCDSAFSVSVYNITFLLGLVLELVLVLGLEFF